jgi:hypothetical protein
MQQRFAPLVRRAGQGAGVVLILAAIGSGAVRAAPDPPPQRPAQGGVVTPPAQVDPGMTKPTPRMPPRSTPVIHPHQLGKSRHGNVEVVPK